MSPLPKLFVLNCLFHKIIIYFSIKNSSDTIPYTFALKVHPMTMLIPGSTQGPPQVKTQVHFSFTKLHHIYTQVQ